MKKKINFAYIKSTRTHDKLYLKENRYEKTKEIFIFLNNVIKKYLQFKNSNTIITDYGCAAGELAFFLKKKYKKKYKIFGCDINKALLNKAKRKVKNVFFFKKDITKKTYKNFSDLSISIGTMSIFDDFSKIISNLIYSTKKKGVLFLHFLSNDYDVDIIVKYANSVTPGKLTNQYKKKYLHTNRTWESGWNVFSKSTIANFLKTNPRVKSFYFKDFSIKCNLKKNKQDSLRSWTTNIDGKKKIINSLGIVQNHTFVIINLL
jgi:SAM-dependent methyltransferase